MPAFLLAAAAVLIGAGALAAPAAVTPRAAPVGAATEAGPDGPGASAPPGASPGVEEASANGGHGHHGGHGRDHGASGGGSGHGRDHGSGQEGGAVPPAGPAPDDYVDIREVPVSDPEPRPGSAGGADGTYTASCGRNENGLFTTENVIVAPGVAHGAQHTHDYVGNQDVERFTEDTEANDRILAQGDTNCADGDRSMYYWPVLRDITREGPDASAPGGGADGNVGRILTPESVTISFHGSATEQVTAMPRFIQVITGNARAATSGGENANAQWTCTGFTDRITTDEYPLCPDGGDVMRIMDFPSCWDGIRTDSDDNRSHIVFPDDSGTCPEGTAAVPRQRQTLVYDVPDGRTFAIDGFPEEARDPVTDHSDFINVMPEPLMKNVVTCINSGRDC